MTVSPPEIRAGFSLPQYYYNHEDAYVRDVAALAEHQWLLIDHASSIPAPGDYVVHEVLGESIIVVRDKTGELRAWYNVCRHRGSRLCLEKTGHVRNFTCPYHAWSFNLDGMLRAAPGMSDGFDKRDYPLHPCHIGEIEGLVFLNLSRGVPPSFVQFSNRFTPFLQRFGIGSAKIAHRQRYRAAANWKLVSENNFECYHCRPSHPALVGANPGMIGEVNPAYEAWKERATAGNDWIEGFLDSADSDYLQLGQLFDLGRGAVSSTMDGKPAAPLMASLTDYSGTSGYLSFNPISGLGAFSDYAIMLRFAPLSASETDYEISWLVNASAREGTDYDLERLRALWDVTTQEDKVLAMNNQAGVNSRAYQPGPYSLAESRTADFVRWYQRLLAVSEPFQTVAEPLQVAA